MTGSLFHSGFSEICIQPSNDRVDVFFLGFLYKMIMVGLSFSQESGMATPEQSEELARLKGTLEEEEVKRRRWKVENIRRKHNYIPLIVNMLKILAKEGHLLPLYETALQKSKARLAKEAANKEKQKG